MLYNCLSILVDAHVLTSFEDYYDNLIIENLNELDCFYEDINVDSLAYFIKRVKKL